LATVSAATETLLALALIAGFARKTVYLFGAGYSLVIWAMGEGFGAPYQSGSTDVGAALIYGFVFAALFLMDRSGPNLFSLDAYLETRVSWWHRVAEVGRHQLQPAR
jgi:nitrite reductase (NO-forming)